MKVEVINLGFDSAKKKGVFYIGRGSPLGNPWSHKRSKYSVHKVATREEAIAQYAAWIKERLNQPSSPQSHAIDECAKRLAIDGVLVLGCYCKPLPCHGDVLAPIILERAKQLQAVFDSIF